MILEGIINRQDNFKIKDKLIFQNKDQGLNTKTVSLDLPLGLHSQMGSFYHGQCQVVAKFPTTHVFFVPNAIHLLVHD